MRRHTECDYYFQNTKLMNRDFQLPGDAAKYLAVGFEACRAARVYRVTIGIQTAASGTLPPNACSRNRMAERQITQILQHVVQFVKPGIAGEPIRITLRE